MECSDGTGRQHRHVACAQNLVKARHMLLSHIHAEAAHTPQISLPPGHLHAVHMGHVLVQFKPRHSSLKASSRLSLGSGCPARPPPCLADLQRNRGLLHIHAFDVSHSHAQLSPSLHPTSPTRPRSEPSAECMCLLCLGAGTHRPSLPVCTAAPISCQVAHSPVLHPASPSTSC